MIERIKYRDYMTSYRHLDPVKGTYRADDKTIEIDFPDWEIKPSDIINCPPVFDHKTWETRCNYKMLRGHRINVIEWNSGKNASYMVEAYGDSYAFLRNEKKSPSVSEMVRGKGPIAKARAIARAKELAASGLYKKS